VEFPFDIAGNSAPGSCVTAKVTQASKANHVFNSIESQLPSVTSCDLRAAFTARKLYLTTPRITVTEDAEGVPPKMKATFTVRDQAGRTVQGATVNASWSGLAAGAAGPVSVTATTNNSGVAAFETAAPSAVPGCFILTTQLPAASSVVGCTSGGTTPALPQPGISYSSGGNRPADVSFTAADNRPGTPGSQIVAYFWTWGDGTVSVTDRPGITHSYPATGTYNVRLVMKDSLGRVGTATAEVVVRDTPAGNRLSFGQVQVDRLSWYTPVPFALGIARVLVVDQTGAPVEDASVTVSWPPGNETETKTTDSNGEAVFWSEVSGSCVQVMMKEATKAGYASAPASDQPHNSPGCATPPASTASAGAPAADAN
jgi:hypothetical protein